MGIRRSVFLERWVMSDRAIPIRVSRSEISTEINKTGFWRYVRPVFMRKTAPCSAACPVGEDVARIEKLVGRGDDKRALETVLMENPLPAVCGRVCFHPCEGRCNRQEFDEAVAIHHIERFLGDEAVSGRFLPSVFRFPEKNKKIAIVGSGPAGLSAAYFLSILGYTCEIFESQAEPGGILRWGIPAYRLPVDVLASEIRRIKGLGVQLHCNRPVTQKLLETLKTRHDGIFMGCGYGRSMRMNIEGESLAHDGLSLLSEVKRGSKPSLEGPVAVIGGGNTAVDVARTLVRNGIDAVIVYRRRREDMPAFQEEIKDALAEGVRMAELLTPISIEKKDAGKQLILKKMKPSGDKTDGRMRVVPDDSPNITMTVGSVVVAIGADVAESWHSPSQGKGDFISLSHCVLDPQETPIIFGGDVTNSIKSVTDAVASGKQAAMALDIYFAEGEKNLPQQLENFVVGGGPALSMEKYIGGERKYRDAHIVDFEEINLDYFSRQGRLIDNNKADESSAETVEAEARRCFNCGNCNDCDNCRLYCPEVAVIKDENRRRQINTDYCKGCGICVMECPRSAMMLVEEPE